MVVFVFLDVLDKVSELLNHAFVAVVNPGSLLAFAGHPRLFVFQIPGLIGCFGKPSRS